MPEGPIEAQLLDLEKQYWQAIKDRDVQAAMRLTDDPCIVTGAQGVARISQKQFAGMLQAGGWTLHQFELSDVQVRVNWGGARLLRRGSGAVERWAAESGRQRPYGMELVALVAEPSVTTLRATLRATSRKGATSISEFASMACARS